MKSAEPLKCVYELCNDAFCKGTFIHEWIYNVKQLVWILQHQHRKRPFEKKTKLGHQLRTTK